MKNSPFKLKIFQKIKKIRVDLRILFILFLSIIFFFFSLILRNLTDLCSTCFKYQSLVYEITSVTPGAYPVKIGNEEPPQISAKAVAVMDSDSKKILYGKNTFLRFAPASTVKIMTALVALDYYELDRLLTVKTEILIPSTMYLREGEEISFENLLYGLLLTSGNDAALTIAQNYPGGEEAFIEKMNEKARQFNLVDTHFDDVAGLNDDRNFTTAYDLAILASQALKDPTFSRIVSVREIVVFDKSGKIAHSLQNLNRLLGRLGVTGIKTGTTPGAGEVLVSSSKRDGHTIITVVMKSENRFSDSSRLIEWASSNFSFVEAAALDLSRSPQ